MYTKIIGNKVINLLLLTLTLSACGGGSSDSRLDQINNRSSSGNINSSTNNSSTPNTTEVQRMGYASINGFQEGVIGIGISDGLLSAGEKTSLTVNVVSNTGDLVTESITVTFNSRCVAARSAELLLNDNTPGSSVTTANGEASITYRAKGCVGDDRITATAFYQGNSLVAASTLTVASDTVQTITFENASSNRISLRGTGSGETTVLTFQVLGSAGAPMQDVDVTFSLSTSAGGASLTTSTGRTGSNGLVSTTLQAGRIAATARVTAKALGTQVATQSDPILISTGIPDQKSMTLSAEKYNADTWRVNGVVVPITIQLADAFNNPPPAGTYVTFTTSGGSIDPGCTTLPNGSCVVEWRSGEPRPASGRITILAHTPGNESFIDKDSNGWYDEGVDIFAHGNDECLKNAPTPSASQKEERCDDLGDAYLDKNYNHLFDGDDIFIDFDPIMAPGYSAGNGKYNGALCPTADGETEGPGCTTIGVTIRKDIRMVMSSEEPMLINNGFLPGQPLSISSTGLFILTLADINGNSLPAGTIVSINLDDSENIKADRPSIEIVNTAIDHVEYRVSISPEDPNATSRGSIKFTIAVPGRPALTTESTTIM